MSVTSIAGSSPVTGGFHATARLMDIIHLPLIAFTPGLMAGSEIPVFLKFIITLAVTSIICMLSYKYFVRGTLIGIFLNGKVHKNNDQQKVK